MRCGERLRLSLNDRDRARNMCESLDTRDRDLDGDPISYPDFRSDDPDREWARLRIAARRATTLAYFSAVRRVVGLALRENFRRVGSGERLSEKFRECVDGERFRFLEEVSDERERERCAIDSWL